MRLKLSMLLFIVLFVPMMTSATSFVCPKIDSPQIRVAPSNIYKIVKTFEELGKVDFTIELLILIKE
ncbi:hypothetical protein FIU95_12490 [Microbulbifer sp. THAF38]|nr:hypothetical protein FIU95_12490 [Microbulbifer sp. THAF38]